METSIKMKIFELISEYASRNFKLEESDVNKLIKDLNKVVDDIDKLYNPKETTSQIDCGEIHMEVEDIENEIEIDKDAGEL